VGIVSTTMSRFLLERKLLYGKAGAPNFSKTSLVGEENQGPSHQTRDESDRVWEKTELLCHGISRWERGLMKPPANCFLAMGKIAGPTSGWYFWKMAGITLQDVRAMLQHSNSPTTGELP
jgi:hypothetical protein